MKGLERIMGQSADQFPKFVNIVSSTLCSIFRTKATLASACFLVGPLFKLHGIWKC